jgi:hypothetical protein
MTPEQFDAFLKVFQQVMTSHQPSWYEHVDLLQAALVMSLGYIVWSLKNDRTDFKKFIADLYSKYNDVNDRLNLLQGSHSERTGVSHQCRRKEDTEEA